MSQYTLTIRNGPRVERHRHESLDEAVADLRTQVEEIRAEGGLPGVSMLRDYSPEQRVKARVEISTGRIFRRREAGVDVMGDGAIVPFSGGTIRNPIPHGEQDDYAAAVASALRE